MTARTTLERAGPQAPRGKAPRVLHVCTRFLLGGSEQRLVDIVAALWDYEHHVVVGPESDLDLARRQLPGVEVRCEPWLRRSLHPLSDLVAVRRLTGIIRQGRYVAVVTHQSKAGVVGRVAARAADGTPVVHSLSMASFGPGYRRAESAVFRLVERYLAPWTSAYAVAGADLAERFASIGVPPEKLSVIRSGARLPSGRTTRRRARGRLAERLGLSEDRPWILYLGSLEHRKNILSLSVFLQQVVQLLVGPRPALVIAGRGPLEGELRLLMERVGLANDVRFVGHVADPGELVVAADVMVLLSRAEGLPQVLLQGAAAGTPFVATEVDGVDELLTLGANGTVVDQQDIIAAARAALPYLRWRADDRRSSIDLSPWQAGSIRASYARLFESVLATPQPAL